MGQKTLLFTRKIGKEDYLFFETKGFIWSDVHYFSVQTPESDVVLFNSAGTPYTLYGYLPKWKLNKIKKLLEKYLERKGTTLCFWN